MIWLFAIQLFSHVVHDTEFPSLNFAFLYNIQLNSAHCLLLLLILYSYTILQGGKSFNK